ncbi:Dyp-type peroxidase [Diaphorobacter aerolatus]|uniref:Dyp-type peroxidase n=1 Tax=Diaphorobacter aerolatus TaxID=1288495 RepID=UPI001D00BA22|nr:Dyp-type peroxidase [Diaphorobacter aerolatus]
MTNNRGDRVPIDAQSIDAPLSKATIFLVVTVGPSQDAFTSACKTLEGIDDLVKTVGFRDLDARLSCIAGIGSDFWQRLHPDARPRN